MFIRKLNINIDAYGLIVSFKIYLYVLKICEEKHFYLFKFLLLCSTGTGIRNQIVDPDANYFKSDRNTCFVLFL